MRREHNKYNPKYLKTMSDNIFNEMNWDEINNDPEASNESKGCMGFIMVFSKKLWSTLVLLLLAWAPADKRLWLSIVFTIIAAMNLLLPNTRDNEIMGWLRLAVIVIAIIVLSTLEII